jgi:hypothetical protein
MHAKVDLKSSHMAMTEFQNMSSVQSKNHTIADLILNFWRHQSSDKKVGLTATGLILSKLLIPSAFCMFVSPDLSFWA